MMKVSKLFIELYGTVDDIKSLKSKNENNELEGILSTKIPNVTIPQHFKNELSFICTDTSKANSIIFRRLIGNLIPDHIEWACRNCKSMISDFHDEVQASFGKFKILLRIYSILRKLK